MTSIGGNTKEVTKQIEVYQETSSDNPGSGEGEKEEENREDSVRKKGEGDQGSKKIEEFAKILNEEVQNMINKY